MTDDKQKIADELMDQGFELLDSYEFKKAIKCGKKLLELQFTGGYQILALAYDGLGKKRKKLDILKEGVEAVPHSWFLWNLLGNAYSDAGRYQEAEKSYDASLKCKNVDIGAVMLDKAIVLDRAGRKEDAVACLRKVEKTHRLWVRTKSLQAFFLCDLGENAKALKDAEAASRAFEKWTDEDREDAPEDTAVIFWQLAKVFLQAGSDKERSRYYAMQAVAFDRNDKRFLALIRDIDAMYSAKAKYYRFIAEGKWPELYSDGEAQGFFCNYDVIADSKIEALEFIKALEDEEIAKTIKINESEVLRKKTRDPKGVYRMGVFRTYPVKKPKRAKKSGESKPEDNANHE